LVLGEGSRLVFGPLRNVLVDVRSRTKIAQAPSAIAGMTMSPQLRESPATAKRQVAPGSGWD